MASSDDDDYWVSETLRIAGEVNDLVEGLKQPQEIHEDSSLATDDRGFDGLRMGTTVGYKIAASAEHLHLALLSMEVQGPSPTAHLTLLRTALLVAAHANRLTERSRRERRVTALQMRADDVRGELTMLRASDFLREGSEREALAEVERFLVGQQRVLQQTATLLGLTVDVPRFVFYHTAAVVEAAKVCYPRRSDSVRLVERIWRLGSSAAHAERSFASRRSVPTEPGSRFGHIVPSRADIGMSAVATWAILRRSVQAFDLRRSTRY